VLTVNDEDEATAKKLKPTILKETLLHGSKKNYKANPHLTVPISKRLSLAVAKKGDAEDKTPVIHKALCRKMEMTIVGVEVVGLCMV
jgi:hypothetical protein